MSHVVADTAPHYVGEPSFDNGSSPAIDAAERIVRSSEMQPSLRDKIISRLPVAAAAVVLAASAGVIGAVGAQKFGPKPSDQLQTQASIAEVNQSIARINADVQQLREQTAQIIATPRPAPPSLGPITSKLDSLASSVERLQRDTQNRFASVNDQQSKLAAAVSAEKRDNAAKLQRPAKTTDHTTTGSLPPVRPSTTEASTPKGDPNTKIDGYSVREVYGKMAVIEDKRGIVYELMKGESLPGIGRIQKLEKKGAGWMVVTDKGFITSKS